MKLFDNCNILKTLFPSNIWLISFTFIVYRLFNPSITFKLVICANNQLESVFPNILKSLPIYISYFPLLSSSIYPANIELSPLDDTSHVAPFTSLKLVTIFIFSIWFLLIFPPKNLLVSFITPELSLSITADFSVFNTAN